MSWQEMCESLSQYSITDRAFISSQHNASNIILSAFQKYQKKSNNWRRTKVLFKGTDGFCSLPPMPIPLHQPIFCNIPNMVSMDFLSILITGNSHFIKTISLPVLLMNCLSAELLNFNWSGTVSAVKKKQNPEIWLFYLPPYLSHGNPALNF